MTFSTLPTLINDTPVHLPEELAEKRVLRDQVRQAMEELSSQEDPKVINLTDRDARMMKTRYGVLPAYNAQSMVAPLDPEGEEDQY